MRNVYKQILFNKHYLVATTTEENKDWSAWYVSLLNKMNIVCKGAVKLISKDMFEYCANEFGMYVSDAFYRNFPKSVYSLSKIELLMDQLHHYWSTYGNERWDEPGHSIFEEVDLSRSEYIEDDEVRIFTVITEEEAVAIMSEIAEDMCKGTRPLNVLSSEFLAHLVFDKYWTPTHIASKDTAISLFVHTKNTDALCSMSLTDIPKVAESLNNGNINKLHLDSKQRKLLTSAIRYLCRKDGKNSKIVKACVEKRSQWKGLLHNIHFKPKTAVESAFLNSIFGDTLKSIQSDFEKTFESGSYVEAAKVLKEGKGSNYLLRNLNRIVAAENNIDNISSIISLASEGSKPLNLLQLYNAYSTYDCKKSYRTFTFTKNNMLKVHTETTEELNRRKSLLSETKKDLISFILRNELIAKLNSKLDKKVYIDEAMKKVAIPLQETTSSSGFDVLARGSVVDTNAKSTIRLFTYWEKVNDIDLSSVGYTADMERVQEFSWRTMYSCQGKAITFSGDQTSGYNGGSEYIDINLNNFRTAYPNIKWVVVYNNVYSGTPFNDCYCKAGYMLRDDATAGKVFEPKSVKTSFKITCDSTFAALFAINVDTGELVWLNTALKSSERVAGCSDTTFIKKYLNVVNNFSLYDLFYNMAQEVVQNPEQADIIISDKETDMINPQAEIIHSYDIEKQIKYLECCEAGM